MTKASSDAYRTVHDSEERYNEKRDASSTDVRRKRVGEDVGLVCSSRSKLCYSAEKGIAAICETHVLT